MTFRIEWQQTGKNGFTFIDAVLNPPARHRTELTRAIRGAFINNFANEGVDRKWPSLAPTTIRDRVRKGFGSGPILVRTGKYKQSFTDMGKGYSRYTRTATGWELNVGSTHQHSEIHEFGYGRIPARPAAMASIRDQSTIDSAFYNFLAYAEKKR